MFSLLDLNSNKVAFQLYKKTRNPNNKDSEVMENLRPLCYSISLRLDAGHFQQPQFSDFEGMKWKHF